jgi:hypothetical protein
MHWDPRRWNIDDMWLGVKRLAAKAAIWAFALSTILAVGVVAIQFGADALNRLQTGTWGSAKTVAEVWPSMADSVAAIKWVGVQRIGLWVIAQSVVWAYLALGMVCFAICGFFMEVHDSLEQRSRWRHSLETRRHLRQR